MNTIVEDYEDIPALDIEDLTIKGIISNGPVQAHTSNTNLCVYNSESECVASVNIKEARDCIHNESLEGLIPLKAESTNMHIELANSSNSSANIPDQHIQLLQQIEALTLQKSLLEQQKVDLERDLDKKTRLHENAMILVRDIQKEHTNNIEVLMLRIKSLESQIENYKADAKDTTILQEELDCKTADCKELEAACLELERELAIVTERANRGLADVAEKQAAVKSHYEEQLSEARQRFQEELNMLEEQLQADHRAHASSHLVRSALEESIADLSSISKELALLSRIAHLQQATMDFMESHVDRVGLARLREASRQARILERGAGAASFPAVHAKVDACIQKMCEIQSELSSAGKSSLAALLRDSGPGPDSTAAGQANSRAGRAQAAGSRGGPFLGQLFRARRQASWKASSAVSRSRK